MEYSKGNIGRVFTVRIDTGEDLLEELEGLSEKEEITSAFFILLGAVSRANLVAGPKENAIPPEPVWVNYSEPHEVIGTGNIFSEEGEPKIHLHTAAGRGDHVNVGCLRGESEAFMVLEVFIMEISGIDAKRVFNTAKGFAPITF
ncbi:MAG: PPC domain-containing DNA-binding protein [Halobacteriota archaeon]